MKSIRSNGIALAYEFDTSAGPHAPVLVLSNSLGTRLEMWEAQMATLRAHFRVLRYDTRGHGRSELGSGPYTLATLGQDVLGLLDGLDLHRVNFCGLSMGGLTGQWLGIYAQPRITRLVLCNTAAQIGTAQTWDARIDAVKSQGMASLAEGVLERWFTAAFRHAHGELVEPVRQGLLQTPPLGYAASCEAIRDADLRVPVAQIKAPTLVIAGTHDPATPPDDGRYLAAQIPGAQYLELDCAHLSNIEKAEGFNRSLIEFLGGSRHG